MVDHNVWDAFAGPWFPVVLILIVILLARERAHIRERWRHIQDFDAQTKAWEKAFADQRENLERHFSNQLDELRRASNVIWIRSELPPDAGEQDDTTPRRKAKH